MLIVGERGEEFGTGLEERSGDDVCCW